MVADRMLNLLLMVAVTLPLVLLLMEVAMFVNKESRADAGDWSNWVIWLGGWDVLLLSEPKIQMTRATRAPMEVLKAWVVGTVVRSYTGAIVESDETP